MDQFTLYVVVWDSLPYISNLSTFKSKFLGRRICSKWAFQRDVLDFKDDCIQKRQGVKSLPNILPGVGFRSPSRLVHLQCFIWTYLTNRNNTGFHNVRF